MTDSKKNLFIFFKKVLPIAFLGIISLSFFWRVFLDGKMAFPGDFVVGVYHPWLDYDWGYPAGVPVKNPIMADVPSFSFPMRQLSVQLMKDSQLPLWNSYILGGTPLLANFQSAPFSPTNLYYSMFGLLTAWNLQVASQHFLVALFTYMLLRQWKASKLGSVTGGIIFAFSGFNLIWSQWNAHTLAASFIPLSLLFVHKYLKSGSRLSALGLTAALTLQIFSGYPQIVFYTAVACGVLWLSFLKRSKQFLIRTLILVLAAGASILLAAIQILPALELYNQSQRGVELYPYEWAFLPWVKMITFIVPDYFGNHATGNYWGMQDYTTNTGFVGVAAMTLALIPLRSIKLRGVRNAKNVYITIAFLITISGLVLSLPTPVSIAIWKSGFIGMQAAAAHRALVLVNLGVAFLAAYGMDYLISKRSKSIPYQATFVHLSLLIISVITLYLYIGSKGNPELFYVMNIPRFTVALRNLVIPLAVLAAATAFYFAVPVFSQKKHRIGALYLILIIFELFRFGWKFTPFTPREFAYPTTPVIEYLQGREERTLASATIPINLHMPYGIKSLEGYDAIYPVRMAKYIATVNSGRTDATPQGRYAIINNYGSRLLDVAGVRYFLITDKEGVNDDIFDYPRYRKLFSDRSTYILENTDAMPKAYMAYEWEVSTSQEESLATILTNDFIYSRIILEDDPGIDQNAPSGLFTSAKILSNSNQERVYSVNAEYDGLLYMADSYYPGWKAYIDGEPAPILVANYAFRAVAVPQGEHTIRVFYEPDSFRKGAYISGAALGLFLLLFFVFAFSGYTKRNEI